MFYQQQYSMDAELFTVKREKDLSYQAHLHAGFELIMIDDGEMDVTVAKQTYRLRVGEALLIFPHQVHSFFTPQHSSHFLCIFSPQLVQAYTKTVLARIPVSNRFSPERNLLNVLFNCTEQDSPIKLKGLLYSVCAAFDEGATYIAQSAEQNQLLPRIFRFVETNYGKDCTLSALSRHTAYHYVYLSQYFKERIGYSFTEYVNRYRLSQACYLLSNSNCSILQISLDCGFESLRTFNRNFKKFTNKTPTEYRNGSISNRKTE